MNTRLSHSHSKRKAISGIVAAVILFAMLFTVGTGYFLSVNNENGLYQNILFSNANKVAAQIDESVEITTMTVQTSPQHIGFFANNTGGITVNITSYYLIDELGNVLDCSGVGVPSSCTTGSPFPLIVNVGKGTAGIPTTRTYVDTGVQPASGATYVLKILTARGNVYSATYPPTATALASQALSSGAIGDLYMDFSSFTYYSVESGGLCPPYTSGGTYSGYCVDLSTRQEGFTMSHTVLTSPSAFSVSITNYNPNHQTITLDEFSMIMQLQLHGSSGMVPNVWYIVSNASRVSGTTLYPAYQRFTTISLPYGVSTLLMFASASPVCQSGQSPGASPNGCYVLGMGGNSGTTPFVCGGSQCAGAGATDPAFVVTHGWKGIPTSETANYGQNSPYVTVLYY